MKTILVVDDSAVIRGAIRKILEPLGYLVREAGDGAEALRYYEDGGTAEAVLLDIDMPVLDGLGFLGRLRSTASLPQPAVVMCTAHSSLDKIQAALEAGANEYVMKPFDAEIISGKLAEVGIA